MKNEDKIRVLLGDLISDCQSNYNRYLMSMMSIEEYKDKKDLSIEDTIKGMHNLDIAFKIRELERGIK